MKVATTVFVGNISEKSSDTLLRQILLVCVCVCCVVLCDVCVVCCVMCVCVCDV